jgi:SAM-dependent methyltransferase
MTAEFDPDAFNRFERSSWERRADGYLDGFARLSSRTVGPLLDAVGVRAGTRLLDVGCGPGVLAARAVERGATVAGVDVAEPMLEIARSAVPGAVFQHADAQAGLHFPDACFDVVAGNMVLHHFGRPEAAVAEMARVVCPAGRVGLTVWDPPEHVPAVGIFGAALERADAPTPPEIPVLPPRLDDSGYHRLFVGAGLDNVVVSHIRFVLHIDPGQWWDAVVTSTALTSALVTAQDTSTQRRIRAAYDELVQQYVDASGRAALPASATLTVGQRP